MILQFTVTENTMFKDFLNDKNIRENRIGMSPRSIKYFKRKKWETIEYNRIINLSKMDFPKIRVHYVENEGEFRLPPVFYLLNEEEKNSESNVEECDTTKLNNNSKF